MVAVGGGYLLFMSRQLPHSVGGQWHNQHAEWPSFVAMTTEVQLNSVSQTEFPFERNSRRVLSKRTEMCINAYFD